MFIMEDGQKNTTVSLGQYTVTIFSLVLRTTDLDK